MICTQRFDVSTVKPMASLSHLRGHHQPTRDDRGWFINPIGPNPWWTVLAASIPAVLCTILIFMDQQITAVIINRKEHKLLVRSNEKPCQLPNQTCT